MLSISQDNSGYYCYEWTSTENGPKVINYSFLNVKSDLNNNHTLEEVINLFNPQLNKETTSLSLTLSITNVTISSFSIDKNISNDTGKNWYESHVLNNDFRNHYDIYYYPMYSLNYKIFLVVGISKELKKNILNLSGKLGYELLHLSVDIFSASISAKQVLKISKNDDFLIWKIDTNNVHYFIYYKSDNIASFIKCRSKNKQVEFINKIGSKQIVENLISYINQIVTFQKNKENNFTTKTYVYQIKGDMSFIKSVVKNNINNVQLLDISSIFNKSYKNYEVLKYVENGMSLKGVDV